MFVYILILICMGVSMFIAGRHDIADGNTRDGRFLIGLGVLSLLASAGVAFIPV